ncbi:Hypothetical protein CAP_1623 [Chondromyces apiculatus DSM 436]|uniref:Uncharacterized protein n=1 Tax=Chondromyces apiculatus DSM 436 TaxID=1192034 RepID=A0A017SST5_9BACT|nr:Hypothetical protein CAP_1623 [Chondromyces apiculatus DSM 436]
MLLLGSAALQCSSAPAQGVGDGGGGAVAGGRWRWRQDTGDAGAGGDGVSEARLACGWAHAEAFGERRPLAASERWGCAGTGWRAARCSGAPARDRATPTVPHLLLPDETG